MISAIVNNWIYLSALIVLAFSIISDETSKGKSGTALTICILESLRGVETGLGNALLPWLDEKEHLARNQKSSDCHMCQVVNFQAAKLQWRNQACF